MRTLVLAALAGALATAAPAGAVIGGQPDADHPFVVAVAALENRQLCSGSLLSERVVVTAAHCFRRDGEPVLISAQSPIPWPPTTWAVSGTARVHAGFCFGCAPGLPSLLARDVAVVTLDLDVPAARYARLPALSLSDSLGRSDLTVVGYGAAGFHVGGGPPAPYLTLQRASATVNVVPGNHSWRDEFLRVSASEARICYGDSGGPNLLGDTIVAITSNANRMCAGVSYSYRLDTPDALAFVRAFLGR